FSLAFITVACIFGAVSGTPSSCSPNLAGAGVSIVTGAVEGAVSFVMAGTPLKIDGAPFPLNSPFNWQVDQTTSSANLTYILKEIGNDELALDVVHGELTLEQTDSSRPTQIWEIQCNQCLPGASSAPGGGGQLASGCSIKSATGLCATLRTGVNPEFLGLDDCNPVGAHPSQFSFWTMAAPAALRAQNLDKRCDTDDFDVCLSGCNIPICPGCDVGCTIGCCGSTGCC
ncbi:hypothetical protein GGX14DRAFT_485351, partial [Mycena pura]